MIDWKSLEEIKKLTIKALVSDDELYDKLILKGGNALDLIHKIADRASIDLDFSIEDSFDDSHLKEMEERIRELLKSNFKENGYHAHDIKLSKRPSNMDHELDKFWGGYKIQFKIISSELYDELKSSIDEMRRRSIPIGHKNSTNLRIEISRFEHCPSIENKLVDGYTVKVYTPTLIAIEKLRAICQQMDEYKKIIPSSTISPRARDFFDIYTIIKNLNIDLLTDENRNLLKFVFEAKKVPLEYLKNLESSREFHRQDFEAVKDTVKPGRVLENFDFYFGYVKSICDKL